MGNLASDRKCMRTFSLKLSKNTDADIISRLESVDNIQGYIKGLIRADMKGDRTMKETLVFAGYNPDGQAVRVTLEGYHVYIEIVSTGEKERWNDEYYDEDQTDLIRFSMLNEGYKM